ncbi:MAG: hypothetical protein JXA08_05100 [Methanomicrobiaceae archaeon]|nr:hypothetical protein [Methanomicrobiaceae archaeon]
MNKTRKENEFIDEVKEELFWINQKKPIGVPSEEWEREKNRFFLFVDPPFFAVTRGLEIIKFGQTNNAHLALIEQTGTVKTIDFSKDREFRVSLTDGGVSFSDNVCEWCGAPFPEGLTRRQSGKRRFCDALCKQRFAAFEKQFSALCENESVADGLQLLHDLGSPAAYLLGILQRGRTCLHCGGDIPPEKPLNSRFCCDLCRFAHHNAKKKR